MPKVKIIYSNNIDMAWDDVYTHIADSTDWVEITDEELKFIEAAMNRDAAYVRGTNFRMNVIVERNDAVLPLIKSGRELLDKIAREEKERQAKVDDKKKKLKERTLQRKREQLEKLRQELGE